MNCVQSMQRLLLGIVLIGVPCTMVAYGDSVKQSRKEQRKEEKRRKKEEKKCKRDGVEVIQLVPKKPTKEISSKKSSQEKSPKIEKEKVKKSKLTVPESYALLDEVYAGVSGFGISKEDEDVVRAAGGAPTYGEITPAGWQTIIDDIKPGKKDVFYDLGGGVGKVTVQMYLNTPVKKAVGVELCKKRFNDAELVRQKLAKKGYIESGRKLEFVLEDIAKANIKDATIIFTCSTCFDPELMLKLVKKFAQAKRGLRVLSLKQLPESKEHGLELVKEYKVPMTWMPDGSSVYLYELVG